VFIVSRVCCVSLILVGYCVTVWYWIAESVVSVCSWWCIVERCGVGLQRVVCYWVVGGVMCSGVYWGAASGVLVCS
jgi:hypothetical protein